MTSHVLGGLVGSWQKKLHLKASGHYGHHDASRTMLPNFILIRFNTKKPSAFLEEGRHEKNNKKRGVAAWDQFLVQTEQLHYIASLLPSQWTTFPVLSKNGENKWTELWGHRLKTLYVSLDNGHAECTDDGAADGVDCKKKTKWQSLQEFCHLWIVPRRIRRSSEGCHLKISKIQSEWFFHFLNLNKTKIRKGWGCFGGSSGNNCHFVCGLTCNHEAGQRYI